jgi:hypothetical protein
MTIGMNEPLRILRRNIGGVDYPYIEFAVSHEDSVNGFMLEVDVGAVALATTTVEVFNLSGDENIATERAGNTHYDVNAAAAAKKFLGNMTFDFTTYTRNKVYMKQGVASGGVTLPVAMLPIVGFLFLSTTLKVSHAKVTRRTNRMGG